MSTRIIVDQLEAFIKTQSMEGPFAHADNFYGAMLDFLSDEEAKEVIRTAWMKQSLKDVSDDPEDFIPAEEVFARLRERTDQAIRRSVARDLAGIRSDRDAVTIMLDRIRYAIECCLGVQSDTFTSIPHMWSTVERSAEVVNTLLRTLSPNVKEQISLDDIDAIQNLVSELGYVAEDPPLTDLWLTVTLTFPHLEKTLEALLPTLPKPTA